MNTLLPYVFLALFATVRAAPLQKRGSVSTCTDLIFSGVDDPSLTATCPSASNGDSISSIALDSCVGNDDANLGVGNDFSHSCSQIALNGLELSAECMSLDPGVSVVGSEVSLDTVLTVDGNGALACSG
ncbi:hypothetical protein B0H11DRAFT_2279590 [Mycena galericulata]|nr:hypothetical protein B0H11DRAFT_2279590 [Mycena galericulata]